MPVWNTISSNEIRILLSNLQVENPPCFFPSQTHRLVLSYFLLGTLWASLGLPFVHPQKPAPALWGSKPLRALDRQPMGIQWASNGHPIYQDCWRCWQWDPNMKRILPASPQTWQLWPWGDLWWSTSIKKSINKNTTPGDGNMQVLRANKHWFQPQACCMQRWLETRTGLFLRLWDPQTSSNFVTKFIQLDHAGPCWTAWSLRHSPVVSQTRCLHGPTSPDVALRHRVFKMVCPKRSKSRESMGIKLFGDFGVNESPFISTCTENTTFSSRWHLAAAKVPLVPGPNLPNLPNLPLRPAVPGRPPAWCPTQTGVEKVRKTIVDWIELLILSY